LCTRAGAAHSCVWSWVRRLTKAYIREMTSISQCSGSWGAAKETNFRSIKGGRGDQEGFYVVKGQKILFYCSEGIREIKKAWCLFRSDAAVSFEVGAASKNGPQAFLWTTEGGGCGGSIYVGVLNKGTPCHLCSGAWWFGAERKGRTAPLQEGRQKVPCGQKGGTRLFLIHRRVMGFTNYYLQTGRDTSILRSLGEEQKKNVQFTLVWGHA